MARRAPFPSRVLALTAVLGSVLVAGCGGGGDGASSGGASSGGITAKNAREVASQAYVAMDVLAVAGGFVSNPTATASPSTVGKAVQNGAPKVAPNVVGHQLRHGVATAAGAPPAAVMGKAVHAETRACPASGTVTMIIDDVDNDGNPRSVNDSMTFRFEQCTDQGSVMNGSIRETFVSSTSSADQRSGTSRSTLTIDGLAVTANGVTETGNGRFDIDLNWHSMPMTMAMTLTGSMFRVVGGDGTIELVDFRYHGALDNAGYTLEVATTLNSPFGPLRLSTPTAFGGDGRCERPTRGTLEVVDADGSRLALTALSCTEVRLDVDTNGDGRFDSTETLGWDQIDQAGT